ncbi:MAG: alpha/beta hydrolase family esterase [Longimicrobiaceae bacterium]
MTVRAILTMLAALTMTTIAADAAAQSGTFEWHTHSSEAGTRRYKLFVPTSVDARRPAPLVVMLHGCTQDPDDFARGTRFNQLAAEKGVIVAWPEQTGEHHPQKCWTWYDPAHQASGRGEPALVAGIAREVMAQHAVDARRVYVAGVSAGAGMAVNAAAAYPELFAAVASHSGIPYRAAAGVPHAMAVMRGGSPDPAILAYALQDALGGRRLPLLAIHGAADAVVSATNSRQLAAQWAGVLGLSASAPERAAEGGLGVERTRWKAADGSTTVELVIVDSLGHAWSGGSPEGTYTDARGPDAARLVLDFLLAHRR